MHFSTTHYKEIHIMAIYKVYTYAIAEVVVEADTPEEAEQIASMAPLDLELVKSDTLSTSITDYSIAWSDCMGSEVVDSEGETVLCDY
jgi:hypothetical protein